MKKILILTTLLTLTAYTASSCGSKNDEPNKEITEPNKAKPEASAEASSVKIRLAAGQRLEVFAPSTGLTISGATQDGNTFVAGPSGLIGIDGIRDTLSIEIPEATELVLDQEFPRLKKLLVSAPGSKLAKLSLKGLPNLEEFTLVGANTQETLDLSHSGRLKHLTIGRRPTTDIEKAELNSLRRWLNGNMNDVSTTLGKLVLPRSLETILLYRPIFAVEGWEQLSELRMLYLHTPDAAKMGTIDLVESKKLKRFGFSHVLGSTPLARLALKNKPELRDLFWGPSIAMDVVEVDGANPKLGSVGEASIRDLQLHNLQQATILGLIGYLTDRLQSLDLRENPDVTEAQLVQVIEKLPPYNAQLVLSGAQATEAVRTALAKATTWSLSVK